MARAYAFTEIRRGNNDGSVDVFPPGTDITGEFDREQIMQLLAQGSAATYDRTKSTDDLANEAADAAEREQKLKERIAQLEQLNETLTVELKDRGERVAALTEDAEAKMARTENPDGTVDEKETSTTAPPQEGSKQPTNEPK
jgi:hypothetical protein